jgi:hypothetical protein
VPLADGANRLPLPWWERIEVRGINPMPFGRFRTGLTFPLQGGRNWLPSPRGLNARHFW